MLQEKMLCDLAADRQSKGRISFNAFMYQWHQQCFGLAQLSGRRLVSLLQSTRTYWQQLSVARCVARFVGIWTADSWGERALQLYLMMLRWLQSRDGENGSRQLPLFASRPSLLLSRLARVPLPTEASEFEDERDSTSLHSQLADVPLPVPSASLLFGEVINLEDWFEIDFSVPTRITQNNPANGVEAVMFENNAHGMMMQQLCGRMGDEGSIWLPLVSLYRALECVGAHALVLEMVGGVDVPLLLQRVATLPIVGGWQQMQPDDVSDMAQQVLCILTANYLTPFWN
jgi:hypothetical protein